jgi:hypothetical protein
MNTNKLVAIILIVIGVIALAYQGITFTTREKDVDLGPLQISHSERHTVPLGPIVGAVALVGGLALLIGANRKTA